MIQNIAFYATILMTMLPVARLAAHNNTGTPADSAVITKTRTVEQDLDFYYEEGLKHQKKGRFNEFIACMNSYKTLALQSNCDTTYQYTEVLQTLARHANRNGQRAEAAQMMERVVELRRYLPEVRPGNLSVSIGTLASIYDGMNRIDTAIVLQEEALAIDTRAYGPKSDYAARDKVNLAAMLYSRGGAGDLQRAIRLAEDGHRRLPDSGKEQATAINSLVLYYSSDGNNKKATEMANKALRIGAKAYGKTSAEYASILANHSLRLAHIKNYTQALSFANEARNVFEASGGTASIQYAKLLSNLASYQQIVESYDEAINTYKKAIEVFKTIEGENSVESMRCKSELASVYNLKGDNEQATNVMSEISQSSNKMDTSTPAYARMLRTRATTQAGLGNYAEALNLEQQAIDIFRAKGIQADIAICASAMANYYNSLGQRDTALVIIQKAIDLFKSTGQSKSSNYAQALNMQSIMLSDDQQAEKALEVSQKASSIYELNSDTTNSFYARILANQAVYCHQLGYTKQAIPLLTRSLRIQEHVLGPDHPDNVMSVFNQAIFYKSINDTLHMKHAYRRALNMQMNYVRRNFSHLTSREREMYWNKKSYVLRSAPDFAYVTQNNDSLITDIYNAMLFTKGLLLNSELDFRNLLTHSGNTQLKQMFDEWVELNRRIDDDNRPNSDVLDSEKKKRRTQAAEMERKLVKGCKEFGDFTQNLSMTVEDIRSNMSDTDVVIEFMKVNLTGGDKGYAALMMRKRWDMPRLFHLFTQKQLNDHFTYEIPGTTERMPMQNALKTPYGINQIFADPKLGKLVWNQLVDAWGDDVRNVYFSPDGMMYQWGIEYLICGDLGRMCDRYDMHRVSSTKVLCQKQEKPELETAAVFGGLNYDLKLNDLKEDHRKIQDGEYFSFADFPSFADDNMSDYAMADNMAIDSLRTRGNLRIDYLPGTHDEAHAINQLLLSNDISCDLYAYDSPSGAIGSEESFKMLSGRGRDVIHIATHGFYFTAEDMKSTFKKLSARSDDDNAVDNSMSCSGLLMAGAKFALKGGNVPPGIENGVLTAREISLLDLRGLPLLCYLHATRAWEMCATKVFLVCNEDSKRLEQKR